MKSRAITWTLLFFLVIILGGITTGLTFLLMSFDQREHLRKHLDQTEEWDRTLLWHLESHLGQFITTENARPYEDYLSPDSGSAFVFDKDLVSVYFHIAPDRTLTHPKKEESNLLDVISKITLTSSKKVSGLSADDPDDTFGSLNMDEKIDQEEEARALTDLNQKEIPELQNDGQIIRRLSSERAMQDYLFRSQAASNAYSKKTRRSNSWANVVDTESSKEPDQQSLASQPQKSGMSSFSRGRGKAKKETSVLDMMDSDNLGNLRKDREGQFSKEVYLDSEFMAPSPLIQEGVLKPFMLKELLVLHRQVQHGGEEHHQGFLIPWSALQKWAEKQTLDLGRAFTLHPSNLFSEHPSAYQLAMIPALLVAKEITPPSYRPSTILRWVLFSFWGAMGIAVLILTFLFLGILKLSKRRGMFASAVTHELRTPLTTFSMYTEMLDEGMVRDPIKQKKYIEVLRRESDRLSHLVENVLAYSRLEQRKLNVVNEAGPLTNFVSEVLSRGKELARQKNQPLNFEIPSSTDNYITRCDSDHVGQIMFNMIENAIKYGCPKPESPIDISFILKRKKVLIKVRDHGLGVSPTFRRRLFKPFSKSDRDAADTSHGVGLGLALCRSLARQLGGDLRYIKVQPGACFELILPIEKSSYEDIEGLEKKSL